MRLLFRFRLVVSDEQREVKRRFEEKEREKAQKIAKEERLAKKRVAQHICLFYRLECKAQYFFRPKKMS